MGCTDFSAVAALKARVLLVSFFAMLLSMVAAVDAGAHTGFGIVVDRQGRVVFLDSNRSKVWRVEADGTLTTLATGKHGNNLVQDAAGNLYVQNFNQTLWRISPDGSVTQVELPPRNVAAGAIGSLDEVIAVDREGNFYVSSGNDFYQRSPQILKITPAGEVVLLAGSAPGHADGQGNQAQFSHIRSAAWGPDGALYVADGDSVRRVTLAGEVTTLAGGEKGLASGPGALEGGSWVRDTNAHGFQRVFGIAVDTAGNVYAVDSDNFRIVRIGRDGRVTTLRTIRLPWKPSGVTVAGDAVYVLENMFVPLPGFLPNFFTTRRVVRVEPEGSTVTLATVGGGGGYVLGGLVAAGVLSGWQWRRRRARKRTG